MATFLGRRPEPAVPNWAHLAPSAPAASDSVDAAELRATPARERFLEFDTSGDGRLNQNEVKAMIESLGMPLDDLFLAGVFATLDDDGTGYIEYGEFEQLWQALADEHARTVRRMGGTAAVSYEVRGASAAAASTEGLTLPKMLRPKLATPALAGRALRDGARRGDMAAVRALLDEGPLNVNEGDPAREHETPLHLAAAEGHVNVVEALLSAGAAPSVTTTAGWTALHRAALWGQAGAAAALVRGGADFRVMEVHGATPRDVARQYGHQETVQFLDSVGAADAAGNVRVTHTFADAQKQGISASLSQVDRR